ncbi:HD domain-containing protein [Candidatus Roizmanbacteria bacterium]|nr:HD domain-containing protein [Candidatus Roizmanbacteria bacterium]
MEPSEFLRQTEALDISERGSKILEIAKTEFKSTALCENRPWNEDDVQRVRQFFIRVAPHVHHKIRPSYWEHLLITSQYARKIAESIASTEADPNEAEALGLLHDIGKIITPDHYLRTDALGRLLAIKAGVRMEVFEKIAPLNRILGISALPVSTINDLSLPQIINHTSDNMGRKNSNGELINVEDVLSLSSRKSSTDSIWYSERDGLTTLSKPGFEQWANNLVLEEITSLKDKYHVDFGKIRSEVGHDVQKPENTQWLLAVQNT